MRHRLRTLVADTADANANPEYAERRWLDRTALVAEIDEVVRQVDSEALEAAVSRGACEAFTYDESAPSDDRYYEGTSTTPAHVAAGLVVPREDLLVQIASGLRGRGAVVITGPSGVGKSAVLWTVPSSRPDVLWYRVRRLSDAEVPDLIALARAHGAGFKSPVDLLVDAAGTRWVDGWARLRAEAAAVPGLLLVCTARTEDLITLGDLADCSMVDVRLDEKAAEEIFEGLVRRGGTDAPHWREAFIQSGGLTMEYTHLLTRGRRLADVITDQVGQRLASGREVEIDVLRLVSVADRWSASVPISQLAAACDASDGELRRAISRLRQEHLVVEQDGVVEGRHQLRSQAICDAVHEHPPPTLRDTVAQVTHLVPTSQAHRFVAGVLRAEPELLGPVVEAVCSEEPSLDRLTACLHGVRLADFYALATAWQEIAESRNVPPSTWTVLFSFTVAGLEISDPLPAELRAAQREMEIVETESCHAALVDGIGADTIARLVASTADLEGVADLFAVCAHATPQVAASLMVALEGVCPFVEALRTASLESVAACLATAQMCNTRVARALIDALGGADAMIRRIRAHEPWIVELDVQVEGNRSGARCRFLQCSGAEQGDPQEAAHRIARLLRYCMPGIDDVDVRALVPGVAKTCTSAAMSTAAARLCVKARSRITTLLGIAPASERSSLCWAIQIPIDSIWPCRCWRMPLCSPIGSARASQEACPSFPIWRDSTVRSANCMPAASQ